MSWTKWQCLQCMAIRGKCNGSCRKILPPRRVSTPHNLDPLAYQIQGGDSDYERFMIYGIDDDLLKGG